MKKWIFRLIGLALVASAGWYGYQFFQKMPGRLSQVPTTRVRRGDVVVRTFTRGELRAVRSVTLTAPNLFGTVQVTKLAPLGSFAREKDLIVEFDDSEVQSRLDSKELELEQIDEQIKKAQADLAIRNNQDQVDLLRARYAVRRAELEVKRNELLSDIDQKKNLLNLEEARRRLKQLESDIKSKQEQAQAQLNVLRETRNKGVLELNREKMRLSQVKLLSPISGLVAIKQNRSGFSGMFGTQVPDIREGDQIPPGSAVADVLDLSELEVIARVGELDRANLRVGQDVLIRLDAVADHVYNGKIKGMSGTASANVFSSDPGKKFDVIFSIDMKQLLTSLGAKPDQIAKIMATAEANRKKPIAQTSGSLLAAMGGMQAFGGGMPGTQGMQGGGGGPMQGAPGMGGQQMGTMAVQGGMQGGPGAEAGRGNGGNGGGSRAFGGQNMTDEQRQKMRETLQKLTGGKNIQDLSPEERQKVFAQMRETMEKGSAAGATKGGAEKKGPDAASGAEGRRGNRGADAAGPGMGGGMGGGQFSAKDMESAKLPLAPGEDSQLEVLLRPGLLADVEIIVEKVPEAIFVPNQSIFESEGKPVVYVKEGDRFEPRVIQIAKRSETVSVISSGLKVGDTIAMSDPTAKPGDKRGGAKKGAAGGGAMGALPVGGSKGGQ
ncbi:MAG: HlyD family efflux transporter periplasmic adaptor subunit [Bryobacterales bacterium]|nr:HlyD family efflux transporter periplasmic adaptor subunit [Bryobacterales bacterium]